MKCARPKHSARVRLASDKAEDGYNVLTSTVPAPQTQGRALAAAIISVLLSGKQMEDRETM